MQRTTSAGADHGRDRPRAAEPWLGRRGLVTLLVGFWAVWFTVVFLTNCFDGLAHLGAVGDGWTFRSGNYAFLREVMAVHDTPESIVALVFAVGVGWELAVAVAMWWTVAGYVRATASRRRLYLAFLPAIGFFAAFLVLTELFVAYDVAATHVRLFVATLLSAYVVDRWW